MKNPPTARSNLTTLGILISGMIAISLGAIFIRYAQNEGVPSLVIAASRLTIAAVAVTPFALQRSWKDIRALQQSDLILAALCGVFLALHFAAWVTSLEYTSVLISTTLVTTTPIWAALMELLLLKSRLRTPLLIGMVIAMLGGLFIGFEGESVASVGPSSNLLLGSTLSLIGAITFSAVLVIGRKLRQNMALLPYIWLIYSIGGALLLLMLLIMRVPITGYSPTAYLWLLASAAFPQLIGHTALNYAVAHVSATYVSITTKMEPIGSGVLAYLLFAETPSPWQIVGSVIILAGIIIASVERRPRSSVAAA